MISSHDDFRVVPFIVSGSCSVANHGYDQPEEKQIAEDDAQHDTDNSSSGRAGIDASVGCG